MQGWPQMVETASLLSLYVIRNFKNIQNYRLLLIKPTYRQLKPLLIYLFSPKLLGIIMIINDIVLFYLSYTNTTVFVKNKQINRGFFFSNWDILYLKTEFDFCSIGICISVLKKCTNITLLVSCELKTYMEEKYNVKTACVFIFTFYIFQQQRMFNDNCNK